MTWVAGMQLCGLLAPGGRSQISDGHSASARQPRQTCAVASQKGVLPLQSLASRQPTQAPLPGSVVRQCGVDGSAAAQAPSGSDDDKQETQVMATQIGVAPLQVQPAMSVLPPAMSPPPPTMAVWHSCAIGSQAKPDGHGRNSSQ